MRQSLSKYLLIFKRMYPTHPTPETWEVYERALDDVNDIDLAAACEICLRELTYFPMPAEIRKRLKPKDDFIATAVRYTDNPADPQTKAEFEAAMEKAAKRIGIHKIAAVKTL